MLKSRFFKNNFIFMTGTLVSGLLGYAYHFIVARELSVAQYGELQSLLSVFVIFGVFNSALSYFVVKHTSVFAARDDRAANQDFLNYLVPRIFKITILLLLILLVVSPALARFLHFSSYLGFILISFSTFFLTMTVIYLEVLRGWQKFFLLSLVGIAATFVKFASGAFLAFLYHTTAIVAFSLLLSAIAGWLLTKYWSEKTLEFERKDEKIPSWKEKYFSETNIRRSAANIFFFSLALVLVSNLDVILVKYFSSPEIAGYYGAFALLGKIILWLNLSVVSVMLPEACAAGHAGTRPEKYALLNSYALMTLIGVGTMIVYFLAPDFIINIFFGNKYVFSAQILWLFGLMSFLLSILTLEANLSFAKHDFRVVYFLAATLILMVAGVAKYHANLAQIVLSFSFSFLFGYLSVIILNLLHEKKGRKFQVYG